MCGGTAEAPDKRPAKPVIPPAEADARHGGIGTACRHPRIGFVRRSRRGMDRALVEEASLAEARQSGVGSLHAAEIAAAQAATAPTARPTVPALEALLFQAIPVLDHGFVRVIDYMGDDDAIVQAARVSYGRGTKRVQRGCRADPLPDAPSAHHPVRDVRDQVPRQTADLRRAAVDPAPHRQRERIFGALLDPGQGILHSFARTSRGAVRSPTARAAATCWTGTKRPRCWTCCAPTRNAVTTIMPAC